MRGFATNIEEKTRNNTTFRTVLYTGKHSQLVLMTLKPHEEIGLETHTDNDQFFRIEIGQGQCIIDGTIHELSDGIAVIVPAGASHNVINTSDIEDLKMYTIYSPAHHKDKIVHQTKKVALSDDEEFDGMTSE